MKLYKIFVLALIITAFTTSNAFSETNETHSISKDSSSTLLVKVKGVGCSSDLKSISNNVEKLDGVSACITKKQGATTTFEVKYNPVLVAEKDIYAAIENTAGCQAPDDRPYKVKK
jgi:copper chaperone CopZ